MALETWLIKVKNSISHSFDSSRAKTLSIKKSNAGVLAFEIAGLMSKLLHLWQSLSDQNASHLKQHSICLQGVRKIVSNDDAFLLSLACAELTENLRSVAKSVARISKKCPDPSLRSFDRLLHDFADGGRDPYGWLFTAREVESKMIKKLDCFVDVTARLHREMDELLVLENGLKKLLQQSRDDDDKNGVMMKEKRKKVMDLQQKIQWQKQQVKYFKDKSLWSRSFDTATSLLARSVFTVLARIKLVFGVGKIHFPTSLPRSLSSTSALVFPSENPNPSLFASGPLTKTNPLEGFFESNSKLLKPPAATLGAAGLALHYANLIIVTEKMIRSPQLVGVDARDDLYSLLPNSVRFALRSQLRRVGFSASDPSLAGEWRDALQKILGWISPLAHNMIKWHSERSYEQQNLVPKTNVLLLQTLFFANQEKTEAAITELLVGLNYIWRFEREMNAKTIFHCGNSNGYQDPS